MAWPASTGGHEMSCQICCRALGPERMWAGWADARPAVSSWRQGVPRASAMKHCSRGLAGCPGWGWAAPDAAIVAWAVWLRAGMRGFSPLVGGVGYLAGPAVVGQSLADPPADPDVQVVATRLQGPGHSRDPGRGRAAGEGVDHVAADPWPGIGLL